MAVKLAAMLNRHAQTIWRGSLLAGAAVLALSVAFGLHEYAGRLVLAAMAVGLAHFTRPDHEDHTQ